MKKSLLRFVLVVLVVVFVLSVATTAFAYDKWPNPKWNQTTFGLVKKGTSGGAAILAQWHCFAAQAKNSKAVIMTRNEVDGVIGPKSVEYIKSYQLKKGLTADGKVGTGTWTKMMTSMSSATSKPVNGELVYNTHDAINVDKTSKHTSKGKWFTYNRYGKGIEVTKVK